MQQQIINLFAAPIYKSSIGRGFSNAELEFFRKELRDPVPAISNFSSRNKNLLDSEEMTGLREIIQKNLNDYFVKVFNTSNEVTLEITQSWLSMTRRTESHHSHTHPNSIASGVLYINLAQQDGISFYRNDDLIWYDLPPKEQNYYNAYQYFVETKVGELVIFPSNIKHGVKPVSEDVERVSLAFNTFFSGDLGRAEFSNSLSLKVV
jgi:uncharacterized protein (TIGR02466 family)